MKIGSIVQYNEKKYIVLYVYGNGYCEIREFNSDTNSFDGRVELVETANLVEIK